MEGTFLNDRIHGIGKSRLKKDDLITNFFSATLSFLGRKTFSERHFGLFHGKSTNYIPEL